MDVEEEAEKGENQESSDRDGNCDGDFGIPSKSASIG